MNNKHPPHSINPLHILARLIAPYLIEYQLFTDAVRRLVPSETDNQSLIYTKECHCKLYEEGKERFENFIFDDSTPILEFYELSKWSRSRAECLVSL